MGAAEVLSAEVLLFDMDGTLVDSTASVERAWGRFAARFDLDVAEILAVCHGRTTLEVVGQFAPSGTDVQAETDRIEAEEVHRTDGIVAIPGARELLESLSPDRWAVVTSATRELALTRIPATGLPVPKVLIGADDVTKGKPDPQPYLMGAEALGADIANAVVFEDAGAGLLSARASGAAAVVVGGFGGEAAAGLPRVPDLRSVRVSTDDGGMRVSLG